MDGLQYQNATPGGISVSKKQESDTTIQIQNQTIGDWNDIGGVVESAVTFGWWGQNLVWTT